MDNLGSIYRRQGKYSQAETVFTKTLDARRRLFGEENPQTLLTMGDPAELYERQGKYEQAEQLSTRVLEVQRRVLGEQHPETLLSMNRLNVTYFRQNDYARLAELFSRVLDVQRRVLGEDHPNTLTTLSNLASMYVNLGDYKRAEPQSTRGLEVQRRVQGEQNPEYIDDGGQPWGPVPGARQVPEAELLFARNLEARQRCRRRAPQCDNVEPGGHVSPPGQLLAGRANCPESLRSSAPCAGPAASHGHPCIDRSRPDLNCTSGSTPKPRAQSVKH